jgi:protein-L-isoaspartate(D-aspartate) O-methyltransferase
MLDASAQQSDDDSNLIVPVALDFLHSSVGWDVAMRLPARIKAEAIPFEKERREMIEVQLRRRGIRDERVLEAMFQVPRHEFVPPALIKASYEDRPLPIGQTETISQPYIVAAMTQAARVEPSDKALEVGTGSGYQAAILAYLGAKVYTLERNLQLAETASERLARLKFANIEVIAGDGSEGYPPAAPYQIILVTAAAPDVPPPLLDQLGDGGRMVIPVGDFLHQDLLLILKHDQQIARRLLDPCQFVPLIGKGGWPERSGPFR